MRLTTPLTVALASVLVAAVGVAAAAGPLPAFDIHIVVLTKNRAAHNIATAEQFRREVDILNALFVTEQHAPLVKFRFKSGTTYEQTRGSTCGLRDLGDHEAPLDTDHAAALFNACDDPLLRDRKAVNFYIYDAYAAGPGFKDTTGHGRRNSNSPFVFIDWRRLDSGYQAAEVHEMGHAFGLGHVCVPGAGHRTPTNIMASADCGKGSGGLRNIGFDLEQAGTISRYAKRISERLR